MMIFVQNNQVVTNRNFGYAAEQVGLFWVKMAGLGPKTLCGGSL